MTRHDGSKAWRAAVKCIKSELCSKAVGAGI